MEIPVRYATNQLDVWKNPTSTKNVSRKCFGAEGKNQATIFTQNKKN